MTDVIKIVQQSFENIKITDKTWFEFWSARDLMKTLGYLKWQKFIWVIEKAKDACKNSWQEIDKHFLPVPEKHQKKEYNAQKMNCTRRIKSSRRFEIDWKKEVARDKETWE